MESAIAIGRRKTRVAAQKVPVPGWWAGLEEEERGVEVVYSYRFLSGPSTISIATGAAMGQKRLLTYRRGRNVFLGAKMTDAALLLRARRHGFIGQHGFIAGEAGLRAGYRTDGSKSHPSAEADRADVAAAALFSFSIESA